MLNLSTLIMWWQIVVILETYAKFEYTHHVVANSCHYGALSNSSFYKEETWFIMMYSCFWRFWMNREEEHFCALLPFSLSTRVEGCIFSLYPNVGLVLTYIFFKKHL